MNFLSEDSITHWISPTHPEEASIMPSFEDSYILPDESEHTVKIMRKLQGITIRGERLSMPDTRA